jgi:predicted P-loop ATPase
VALYRNGVRWWLTNDEEATAMAHDEQADRQIEDAWQHRISGFLEDKDSSSVDEILSRVIDKPCGSWTQHEQNRAAACLRKAGFTRKRSSRGRRRYYYERTVPVCPSVADDEWDG